MFCIRLDRPPAVAPDRPFFRNVSESVRGTLPKLPSFRGRADPLLRFPCPRSLLYPIARPRGRASSPVRVEPPNRVVPGRSPCRRNAGPGAVANPAAVRTTPNICARGGAANRNPLAENDFQKYRRGRALLPPSLSRETGRAAPHPNPPPFRLLSPPSAR